MKSNKYKYSFIFLYLMLLVQLNAQDKSKNDPRWSIDPRMLPPKVSEEISKMKPTIDTTRMVPGKPRRYYSTTQEIEVGPNVQIYPTSHHQAEVMITRHPLNHNIMFVSDNAYLPSGDKNQAVYVTENGGESWIYRTDEMLPTNPNNQYFDPSPIIDKNGKFLHSFISFPVYNNYSYTCNVYSINNGRDFSSIHIISNSNYNDKEFSVTDASPSSPHYGRTYCAWTNFTSLECPPAVQGPIVFAYTDNGGVTWSAPLQVSHPLSGHFSQGVDLALANDGTVYMVWAAPINCPLPNCSSLDVLSYYIEDYVGFAKSNDGGATWSETANAFEIGHGMRGVLRGLHDIRTNSFPEDRN